MKWYALFVQTGKEEEVKLELSKRFSMEIIECIIPKRKVPERKERIQYDKVKVIFPGYIFIKINMTFENYYIIKEVQSIIRLLDYLNIKDKYGYTAPIESALYDEAEHFKSIEDTEMMSLLKVVNEEGIIDYSEICFLNDKYEVKSGPLKGCEKYIKKIDKHKNRAKITLDFMGTSNNFEVGFIPSIKFSEEESRE